jgi:AmmeMemoRadiSam system protein B
MGFQDMETSENLGRAIGQALRGENSILIASTDLTHMENQTSASVKDRGVIERIISFDEKALQKWVRDKRVSMCGYGPVSTAIVASKMLGAKKTEILSYHTSGEITGDLSAVVGYLAAKIIK